ncbi:hypothetical protein L218DRAFT_850339 [Marasmius fiardii PR-910]|nr:hypothetical protein L218DRAFT_850339 [Marasmius fiardii PR-910]
MSGSTASILLSHNRIPLVEASAKIYHAKFGVEPPEWQYFHQRGKVIFGRDEECPRETGSDGSRSSVSLSDRPIGIMDAECYWFRLLDPNSGKVNWLFPVPENLTYSMDKPFFHMFNGRSRLWGFLFEDDAEGNAFGEIVRRHLPTPTGTPSLRSKERSASVSERTSKVTTAMISLPRSSSFAHLAHIGINDNGEVEGSDGVDPSWSRVVSESQVNTGNRYTVTKDTIGCFHGFL